MSAINVDVTLQPRRSSTRNRSPYWGFGLLGFVAMIAVVGPLLTSYDPVKAAPLQALLPPSAEHWFGTNSWGGDVYARVVYAARLDLFIGITSVGLGFLIGAPIGAAVGYHRGWASGLTMRGME